MPSSRIFVSYVCLGDEPGAKIGKQLLSDIRATNTEAVADHETISDERFMPFLMRELPQCGCLIVVQTPAALQSWRVQSALAMASSLAAQQQMKVMRVIAVPSPDADEQPLWSSLSTFDASIDYPRTREKIFLALGLTRLDEEDSFILEHHIALPRAGLPESANGHLPSQPSGSAFGTGGNIRPMQPPVPVSGPARSDWSVPSPARTPQPVGTNWPAQPPAPMAASGGTNWPPQPSMPMAAPGRTNWPAPAASPQYGPAAPVDPTRSRVSHLKNQFSSLLNQTWAGVQAVLAWLRRTSQARIAALPGLHLRDADETIILPSDRPQPLNTTRQLVIRWAIMIGILLVLILAGTLIVLFVRRPQ
jgi:hypothetical protein